MSSFLLFAACSGGSAAEKNNNQEFKDKESSGYVLPFPEVPPTTEKWQTFKSTGYEMQYPSSWKKIPSCFIDCRGNQKDVVLTNQDGHWIEVGHEIDLSSTLDDYIKRKEDAWRKLLTINYPYMTVADITKMIKITKTKIAGLDAQTIRVDRPQFDTNSGTYATYFVTQAPEGSRMFWQVSYGWQFDNHFVARHPNPESTFNYVVNSFKLIKTPPEEPFDSTPGVSSYLHLRNTKQLTLHTTEYRR